MKLQNKYGKTNLLPPSFPHTSNSRRRVFEFLDNNSGSSREKPRQKQGDYTAETGSLCRCSSILASAENTISGR